VIDYYYILGARPEASRAEIKAAYRQAALANHPDRGGDAAVMKRINAAYEVLSDPVRRAAYDRDLARAWGAAEMWAQSANRQAARPAPPPPPPPWATGKWQTQTSRRPPRPAPAPWRHWPVRCVLALLVALFCYLVYSAALSGPWGLLLMVPASGWYFIAAYWVYDKVDDLFLG
jgi:hypothetical protein